MKLFQKKKENFVCDNCGLQMLGDGYTNHCSLCLYSKHVDVNPGDRLSRCGGLMRPVSVIKKGDKYTLVHECKECGHIKKNVTSKNDDMKKIISVASGGYLI